MHLPYIALREIIKNLFHAKGAEVYRQENDQATKTPSHEERIKLATQYGLSGMSMDEIMEEVKAVRKDVEDYSGHGVLVPA